MMRSDVYRFNKGRICHYNNREFITRRPFAYKQIQRVLSTGTRSILSYFLNNNLKYRREIHWMFERIKRESPTHSWELLEHCVLCRTCGYKYKSSEDLTCEEVIMERALK